MHLRLLNFLVCPCCKGDLTFSLSKEESGQVLEGRLECSQCAVAFPIVDGIPNMIPGSLTEDKQKTSRFFENDWRIFDSQNRRFDELLPSYISPLSLNSFKGKVILEAGCGSGRNLLVAAKAGAKDVIGIDISGSVKLAYEKTKDWPNIHIVRADITNLPFRSIFDVIFSVGVLHHLPDPEAGFRELVAHLTEDGIIAVSVYSKENNEWIVKYLNPVRKHILTRLPDVISLFVAFAMAGLTYPAMKLIYKPLNENTCTKEWAGKHLFYNDFLYLLSQLSFKLTWGQFWDQLTAPTAFYISKEEIENWFKKAGLKNPVFEWRNKNCWNGVGVK